MILNSSILNQQFVSHNLFVITLQIKLEKTQADSISLAFITSNFRAHSSLFF